MAGVGRSGTSLFTSILGRAGFHVPQPEVDADSTNPKGFGEPKWAVDFHGRQLRSRRVSVWDSRPSAWQDTSQAVDDPAALAELRGWLKVQFVGRDSRRGQGPADRLVPAAVGEGRRGHRRRGVVRHPAAPPGGSREQRHQVVRRLADAREPDRVLAQHHARDRVRDPRPRSAIFVRYDDLLTDWSGQVARTGDALSVPALQNLDPRRPGIHRRVRRPDPAPPEGELRRPRRAGRRSSSGPSRCGRSSSTWRSRTATDPRRRPGWTSPASPTAPTTPRSRRSRSRRCTRCGRRVAPRVPRGGSKKGGATAGVARGGGADALIRDRRAAGSAQPAAQGPAGVARAPGAHREPAPPGWSASRPAGWLAALSEQQVDRAGRGPAVADRCVGLHEVAVRVGVPVGVTVGVQHGAVRGPRRR